MPALVAGIHVSVLSQNKDVDGRDEPAMMNYRNNLIHGVHRIWIGGRP
jgi:hypothetical protein